jgi:hypothetical protein
LIDKVAPLLSAMLLSAVMMTLPVLPDEPLAAAALIPVVVLDGAPAPSIVKLPAFSVTVPAGPGEEVLDVI